MKIVVLAGGLSPERDVSLSSGALIANALMANGHRVLMVDVYTGLEGEADFDTAHTRHARAEYRYAVPEREPDLERLAAESGNGAALIGRGVLGLCAGADVVFLALHGGMGEDGRLQAVLDCHGIRYTGTGYTGSLLAMDKAVSKDLMACGGVPTADGVVLDLSQTGADHTSQVAAQVGFPCVVKPCGCGSSVGVSMVENAEALQAALAFAARYEQRVIVEKKITGREFSAGILGGQALPVIEMIPKAGFYDYKNKYQPGLTTEICPAELPEETAARIRRLALQVHSLLHLGAYSRVDFMLDEAGGLYCLEANTLPGMTPTSLLPQEAQAAGITYNALCDRIVQLAL